MLAANTAPAFAAFKNTANSTADSTPTKQLATVTADAGSENIAEAEAAAEGSGEMQAYTPASQSFEAADNSVKTAFTADLIKMAEKNEFIINGKKCTIDDIRNMLAEPKLDLSTRVNVADMELSYAELKKLVSIEDELAETAKQYTMPEDLDDEQRAAYASIMAQLNGEGIVLEDDTANAKPDLTYGRAAMFNRSIGSNEAVSLAADTEQIQETVSLAADTEQIQETAQTKAGRLAINHDARIKQPMVAINANKTQAQITFELINLPQGGLAYPVSFSYATADGSAAAGREYSPQNGTITFNAGESSKTITINLLQSSEAWDGVRSFDVLCSNAENILFDNNKSAKGVAVCIEKSDALTDWQNGIDYSQIVGNYVPEYDRPETFYNNFNNGAADIPIPAFKGNKFYMSFSSSLNYSYSMNSRMKNAIANNLIRPQIEISLQTTELASDKFRIAVNGSYSSWMNVKDYKNSLKPVRTENIGDAAANVKIEYHNAENDPKVHFIHYFLPLKIQHRIIENKNTNAPQLSVTAPSGTYYPGQSVPIVLSSDIGISSASASITVNGKVLRSADSVSGMKVKFYYPVGEDETLRDLTVSNMSATSLVGVNGQNTSSVRLSGVNMETSLADTFKSLKLDKSEYGAGGEGARVEIALNTALTNWLEQEGSMKRVKLALPGDDTLYDVDWKREGGAVSADMLTGTVVLPKNLATAAKTQRVELLLDRKTVIGKYADATVRGATFPQTITIDSSKYPADNIIYFTKGLKLDFTTNPIFSALEPEQEASWSSSDDTVATIDKDGNVTCHSEGKVKFTVSLQGESGSVFAETAEFTTVAGGAPEINFSGDVTTTAFAKTTLAWNTNIIFKNSKKQLDTYFDVKVYKGDGVSGECVYSERIKNQNYAEIPENILTEVSADGKRAYTVTVECANPDVAGESISAQTGIVTEALPVVVRFDRSDNYFITDKTDKQAVHISLQNVDETNGAEYRYSVKKNGVEILSKGGVTKDADINFEIELDDVDKQALRDIYIVSAEAHNSDDPASADSFILYVYQDGTMDILVDGESMDEKLLSNRKNPEFTKTRTDKIDWVRENANLKADLSIDRGGFKWCNVDDQIKWKSSANNAASINYNDRGWYSDIEDFEFTSYRPSTEFMLVGKENGSTVISATHAKTGMSTSIKVDVETLKDKLYVFNFYPKQKTTVKYTNGDGKKVELQTNDEGEIAIYEEKGIASDISLKSGTDEDLYLGTLYKTNLISSEADPSKMELYPANVFALRSAAKVKVNILKEDGTPYVGELSVSGGVYKNGKYCAAAELKDLSYTTNSAGEFSYIMDTTKLWTDSNTEDLNPEDDLEYIFIARTANDEYFPLYISMDGNISEKNKASFGENAVIASRVSEDRREKPFIAAQKAKYTDKRVGWSSVMYYNSCLGINDVSPRLDVKNTVLWWGMDEAQTGEVYTTDEYNRRIGNQRSSDVKRYPFSDIAVSENIVTYDDESLAGAKDGKSLKPTTVITDSTGKLLRSQSSMFSLSNLIGVETPSSSANLAEEFKGITPPDQSSDTSSANFQQGGDMVAPGTMSVLSKLNVENQFINIGLYPTTDPNEWRFIAYLGVDKSGDNDGQNVMQDQTTDEFSYTPGPMDIYSMFKGEYLNKQKNDFDESMAGGKGKDSMIGGKAGGFYEGIVKYDFTDRKWKMRVRSGGFTIGVTGGYQWSMNTMVGLVPVTVSVAIAAGMETDLKVLSTPKPYDPNSYYSNALSTLRINAYVKAFLGLGVDLTVFALKFGVFGQVDLDNYNAFLTYMDEYGKIEDVLGQNTTLTGRVGIEFFLKILFIESRTVLASKTIGTKTWETGEWAKVEEWRKAANFPDVSIGGYRPQELAMLEAFSAMETVQEGMYAEDRGYLDLAERVWGSDNEVSLMSLDDTTTTENLQSNAYPYANPYTTDDGKLMVFLSDGDSKDLNATQVQYSIKNGDKYGAPQVIPTSGEGLADSNLQLAGTSEFAVAAWQRQTKQLTLEEGQEANNDDLNAMMSAADVCVSVYKDGQWQTEQLTSNSIPDMAPVVATNGDKAIAVWRRVASASTDSLSATNFDAKDELLYKTYENGRWSEERVLYNGTMGAVKGLNVAMDAAGNAVVTYTADTQNYIGKTVEEADALTAGSEKFEIVYSHIAADGTVSSPVKLTNDENPDENPQITTVKIDGEERFVTAWFTQRPLNDEAAAQNKVGDIELRVVNADGSLYSDFVDSIGEVQNGKSVAVSNKFRFAKGAKELDELALVWTAPAMELGSANEQLTSYDKDELYAVSFRRERAGAPVSLTAPLPVVEAADNTKLDHFDAYVTDEGVKAVLQATTYDMSDEKLRESIRTKAGDEIILAKPISAMRSATAKFVNDIKAEAPIFDYNAIKHNASLPIQINVTNAGKDRLESVTITTDGANGTVREFKNLGLMPNETATLTFYRELESEDELISSFGYSINAKFANDDRLEKSGSVNLQIPDSAIAAVDTTKEEHGVRTMQLKLYNQSDIELARLKRYKVRVGFFKDNACMTPLENEIRAIGADGSTTTLADGTITFDDPTSLTLIDDDAMVYSFEYTLPEAGFANGDINLYTKVWIEDEEGRELTEYYQSNNVGNAVFTDPVARNNGEQFLITSEMSDGANGSTASVSVKNLALTETEKNGNLVVSLLDAKGNVLETKQTAMTAEDLIKLGKEDEQSFSFEFGRLGHAVQCSYNTVSADELDSTLSSLRLDGVALEFSKDKEEYEAEVSNLLSCVLTATTSNMDAKVEVQNAKGEVLATSENGAVAKNLALELSSTDGEITDNVIKLVVTPKNTSAATTTYTVTLHNKAENKSAISLDLPAWTNKSGETEFTAKLRNFEHTPEGYTVQVDDGERSGELKWLGTTESKLTANIPDEEGVHRIRVSVRDDLGFNTRVEKEVVLDKAAPILNAEDVEFVETDTPLNKGGIMLMGIPSDTDGITENQLKVYVKATDALSGVDKVTANAGGRVYEAKLNEDGRYELTVEYAFRGELEITATDKAGNSTTVGKAVNVDDEMPMGSILTGGATTTQTSATLYGTVTTKDAYLAECGIEYRKQGDTEWTTLVLTDTSKRDDFSFTLDELEADTEYVYRVYVRSMANAMFYGDTKTFRLADKLVPSVSGVSFKQPASSAGGNVVISLKGDNLDEADTISVKAIGADGELSADAVKADGVYTAELVIPENADDVNEKTYDIEVYVNGVKQVPAGEVPQIIVPRADKGGNNIVYFYAEGQIGDAIIGEDTIAVTMPYKTDLDELKAKLREIVSLEVSANASCEMKNAKAEDGKLTAEYTVTAENGAEKTYILTISLAAAPAIDAGSFDGISEAGLKTIEIKGANLENAEAMAVVLYDEFGQEVSRARVVSVDGKYSATISVPENNDTDNERTYSFAYVIDGVETLTDKTVKVLRHSYGENKLLRFNAEGAKSVTLDEFTGRIRVVMPYDYAEAAIKTELAYSTGATAKFTVDGNEVSEIPSSGITTLTITAEDGASVTSYEIEVVNEEAPQVNLMSFNANPYNKESRLAIRVTGVNLENAREIKVTATAADGTAISEVAKKSGLGEYTAMLTIPQSLYINEDRVFELSAEIDGVAQEQLDNAQAQLVQPRNNNVIEGFVIEDMLGEAQIEHNDNSDHGEISVVMPYDADLSKLNPSITVRDGAKLTPENVTDFTSPIEFKLTSVNHVDRGYTVTVTKKDAPIIGKVEYVPFTSAKAGKTVVTMTGENLDNLRNAQVTAKNGETSITVDAIVADGVLKAELEIPENTTTETVKWALSLTDKGAAIAIPESALAVQPIPAILEFNIPDQVSSAIINNKITVFMPRGVRLNSLKPEIKLSEGTKVVEPTGETVDFSRGVSYKLKSGDDTAEYSVSVKNQGSIGGGGGGGGSFSGGGGGASTVIKPTATATPEPTATPEAAATPKPSVPFTDVKEGDWYYEAVSKAYADGIMNGISETEFGANEAVTRAMLVTMLHRLEGAPEAAAKARFKDVAAKAYYADAVAWANENGIVKGMSEDEFAPDEKVTREQTAAVLERYADFKGLATDETADLDGFNDAIMISEWAKSNVAWAVGKGLIAGKGDGLLDPMGETTRAELAVILQRFLSE